VVYFLMMTWPWWLLTIGLAVAIIWLIFRDWFQKKEAMRTRIAELESQVAGIPELEALVARLETAAAPAAPSGPPAPDMSEAIAVLGHSVKPDDIAVVEGIGPKIRGLLHAENIRTWRELAGTDVATLHDILHAAGPHFQIHDPATWPRQAELLADGEWERFKEWTDVLKGGREVVPV